MEARPGGACRPREVHADIDRVLFSEAEIVRGIERIASEVTRTFRGTDFTVVAVLKGSCIFASDLVRRIPIPLGLAFVCAQSYRSETEGGALEVQLMPADEEIRGRRVLLVDDILDSGRTLRALRDDLLSRGAAEVRTCVFLDKPSRRVAVLAPDFRCFEVEDVFVVGYGLDYAGRYRNLPFVASLRPEVVASKS